MSSPIFRPRNVFTRGHPNDSLTAGTTLNHVLTRCVSTGTQTGPAPHRAAVTFLASPDGNRVAAGTRARLVARGIAGGATVVPRAPGAPVAFHGALSDVSVVGAGVGVPESFLRTRQ